MIIKIKQREQQQQKNNLRSWREKEALGLNGFIKKKLHSTNSKMSGCCRIVLRAE